MGSLQRTPVVSKVFSWLFKLLLTLVAFWIALRGIDITHVIEIINTQSHEGIFWTILLLVVQIVLGAFRWNTVLRAVILPGEKIFAWLEAVRIYYISIFFNCCLPGTVGGDVVRVWLSKSPTLSLHTAISSVIIDRLIALLALGLLVIITLPSLGDVADFNAMVWAPVIVLASFLGLRITLRMKPFLKHFQHFHPARWLLHFVDCLQMMISRPRASLLALTYSLFSHSCFCLCVYALAQGLNAEITVWQCITLVPLVMLVTTLPISIGGWGVREASMVGMLGLAGVPQTAALALSLEYGIINIAVSLPAAALWLVHHKKQKA